MADPIELSLGGLSEAQLSALGEWLGGSLATPAFLALRGELGAGKSVLARAVARGAGVRANMPSPTFNLVLEYAGRSGVTVRHVDLYRIERPDQVWSLGWQDIGKADEIALVEWPERAQALLPEARIDIWIRPSSAGEDRRDVTIRAVGDGVWPDAEAPSFESAGSSA